MTNFCVWSRSRLFWHGAEADPLWSEPDLVLPYPDPKSPKKSGGSATLKVTVQHDIGIFWTGTLQYSVQDIIEVPIKIRNAACELRQLLLSINLVWLVARARTRDHALLELTKWCPKCLTLCQTHLVLVVLLLSSWTCSEIDSVRSWGGCYTRWGSSSCPPHSYTHLYQRSLLS